MLEPFLVELACAELANPVLAAAHERDGADAVANDPAEASVALVPIAEGGPAEDNCPEAPVVADEAEDEEPAAKVGPVDGASRPPSIPPPSENLDPEPYRHPEGEADGNRRTERESPTSQGESGSARLMWVRGDSPQPRRGRGSPPRATY